MHMRTHSSVERPRRAMKRYARRWERHWWRHWLMKSCTEDAGE